MSLQLGDDLKMVMGAKLERSRVIAITSGKGGVGKSNIAANLAICLSAAGQKVALIDADLGLANVDVLMGLNSKYSLWHYIKGRKTLDEVVHAGPAGVDIICGGSGFSDLADMSRFEQKRLVDELDDFKDSYETIIVDTGAGISKSVIGFCNASDDVVVVATPEPTSITDSYSMIKVLSLGGYRGRISLVVNMAKSKKEAREIYRQIADVSMRFLNRHLYEAGAIVKDEKLCTAVKMRKPLVLAFPKSPAAMSLVNIAARICKKTYISSSEGLFKKVVNWLF